MGMIIIGILYVGVLNLWYESWHVFIYLPIRESVCYVLLIHFQANQYQD